MQSRGVKVIDTINKSGELQGFKLAHKSSDLTYNASKVGKNAVTNLRHSLLILINSIPKQRQELLQKTLKQ